MTTRGRKPKPGRITFVGSGPGDPGLLTTRAATALANAALVFTDPDVPEAVLALIGKDLPPVSGPAPAEPGPDTPEGAADDPAAAVVSVGPDIRPALGDPAEVAKRLWPKLVRATTWCGWWPVTRCRSTRSSPR